MKFEKKICPFCRKNFEPEISINTDIPCNRFNENYSQENLDNNPEDIDLRDIILHRNDLNPLLYENHWNLREEDCGDGNDSGYIYKEEDPDYDEENPYGDSYDYP
jgi:hypothetical protein